MTKKCFKCKKRGAVCLVYVDPTIKFCSTQCLEEIRRMRQPEIKLINENWYLKMENLGLKKEIQNLTRKVAVFEEEATRKDPQSKESNEQLELEDQNQDEPRVPEHADDSDLDDITNDESNNEPKNAAGFDEEAGSKDPQSKEPNEQPELENQNQDEPNIQEPADDFDRDEVSTNESNSLLRDIADSETNAEDFDKGKRKRGRPKGSKNKKSKEPQSKELNEQPELEDQNQNDSNAGEHADDSDWADVTNDEANNEPKKAGPSTVCIYLVMAQRARKFKKVQPKKNS